MPRATAGADQRPHGRAGLKRNAILDAATDIFLSTGYAAASMDAISQAAGVSKATVYNHFVGKEALFGAIIEAQCQTLLSPLMTSGIRTREPNVALRAIADRFIELVMSETALALYRVVMAEAPRFPELAHVFYDNGPAQAISGLAAYLSEQSDLGRLDISDATTAAEQFLSLLTGYPHVRTILGVTPSPRAQEISRHIASTVDVFLRAYARNAAS